MSLIENLSKSLYLEARELLHFSLTSPYRYKVYEIPKRNGRGTRTIAHPSKELKYVQRKLIHLLEEILPLHDAAAAYRKGQGIRENASLHMTNPYLLKMDFKNFFPSISPTIFFKSLAVQGLEFGADDHLLLERLLFWRPVRSGGLILSIGAPTSPLISNFIMYQFDKNVSDFCGEQKIVYSRYADDITFSTKIREILFEIPGFIEQLLGAEFGDAIQVNQEKTVFSSKKHNRHVTGITLTNEGILSVGRARKRLVSAMIHRYSKGLLSEEDVYRLQGELSFIRHIEPSFQERMIAKYGPEVLAKLVRFAGT